MRDQPRPFFVKRRSADGQAVLEVGGECDAATLDELNKALGELVSQNPAEAVVDLAEVTFLDSLTLASLMAAASRVRAGGGSFGVVGVRADVRRVFEITGLDRYLLVGGG